MLADALPISLHETTTMQLLVNVVLGKFLGRPVSTSSRFAFVGAHMYLCLFVCLLFLATDIVDKELKDLRNNRWDKAFNIGDTSKPTALMSREEVNRKATIVLEHLIQASDISHTMQHWHVYRKW